MDFWFADGTLAPTCFSRLVAGKFDQIVVELSSVQTGLPGEHILEVVTESLTYIRVCCPGPPIRPCDRRDMSIGGASNFLCTQFTGHIRPLGRHSF